MRQSKIQTVKNTDRQQTKKYRQVVGSQKSKNISKIQQYNQNSTVIVATSSTNQQQQKAATVSSNNKKEAKQQL